MKSLTMIRSISLLLAFIYVVNIFGQRNNIQDPDAVNCTGCSITELAGFEQGVRYYEIRPEENDTPAFFQHFNFTVYFGSLNVSAVETDLASSCFAQYQYTESFNVGANAFEVTVANVPLNNLSCKKGLITLIVITEDIAVPDENLQARTDAISCWPNPSKGKSNVSIQRGQQKNLVLTVFNPAGQQVFAENISPATDTFELPGHLWPKGVYTILVSGFPAGQAVSRLIVR